MQRVLIALALWLLAGAAQADWYNGEEPIMGTAVTVQLWHADAQQANQAIKAVMAEMHRIDDLMSTWKEDTELSRVNNLAATQPVAVSSELFRLIEQALAFAPLTHGAFDISYASAGFLFDYRKRVKPNSESLTRALQVVDYRLVELDEKDCTVYFKRHRRRGIWPVTKQPKPVLWRLQIN